MRRMLLFITVAAMLLALAVPAFAQGQVERGPEHARFDLLLLRTK